MDEPQPGKPNRPRTPQSGFSLIELMIAIAIVSILLSVGVPSYREYVRRGAVEEVTAALGSGQVAVEQFYLDNHTYEDAPCPGNLENFTIACDADVDSYSITATGRGAMDGFVYAVDQANARTTEGPWGTGACWITRKGGTC